MKVENKFEALKDYSKKYNVKWAFVRDYDKNDFLYYCNTGYTEDMETGMIMAMWNPWRGCKKCSDGCLHCYIHKGDYKREDCAIYCF